MDHDQRIQANEFIHFADRVIANDILPMLAEEMQNRGLL